jgi:hypothetical protein
MRYIEERARLVRVRADVSVAPRAIAVVCLGLEPFDVRRVPSASDLTLLGVYVLDVRQVLLLLTSSGAYR